MLSLQLNRINTNDLLTSSHTIEGDEDGRVMRLQYRAIAVNI